MSGLYDLGELLYAFIPMLGVLVTVHEFGHFLVAKLCGVRVLKFSVGFGSPIGFGRYRLSWTRGGTEYVIAWIPLGGFVKLLGENPGEEAAGEAVQDPDRSLGAQPTWKKLAIYAAGPAMNLVLPVFVLVGTLWVGIERPDAVVGTVEPDSPALAAGLVPGDRILAVDGEEVHWWDEVEGSLRERPGQTVRLEVQRDDAAAVTRELRVQAREGLDLFRRRQEVGWTGLQHTRQRSVVGVISTASAAGRAGLRSGDRVVAVADQPVETWPELRAAWRHARARAGADGSVTLRVVPAGAEDEREESVALPARDDLSGLGLIPAVVLVMQVQPDTPAEAAGLQPGDLIVAVDGEPLGSFRTFQETVLASGGRTLEIQYARRGETRVVRVKPRKSVVEVAEGSEEELYRIGIALEPGMLLPGSLALDRERNPIVAFPRAAELTVERTGLFLEGLKRLVSGEISRRNLGGPIEIARQSQLALRRGWDDYLGLLVLISINLGILNLLPIPILDGGQMLLITVEGVKRGPLSLRTREFVQQLGLVLLVALMGLAFWNDVSKHWSTFVDWVKTL